MKFFIGLNGQTGQYEVHKAGCSDVTRKGGRRSHWNDFNFTSTREGEPEAMLAAELNDTFSGPTEHPAKDGFPGGSFGAAGFTGRIFPCVAKARAVYIDADHAIALREEESRLYVVAQRRG
jgi:hypothetical protein